MIVVLGFSVLALAGTLWNAHAIARCIEALRELEARQSDRRGRGGSW